MDKMQDEPRGARTHAVALPQARQVKRAINSLETGVEVRKPPGTQHPMGDRGYAAQYLGLLKAFVAQIEEGLRGGPLQVDVQKGWFGGYEGQLPSLLANTSSQVRDLSEFARQGIVEVPHASQQMSVAAAALLTAEHAFAAASEISVGIGKPDFNEAEVVKQSEAMYEAYDLLAEYVRQKREQFGES
ncbi:hypothetical protein M1P56_35695 (plasmid) [Streptomyces sp. HU2014]|uniref:hypothetical protein n=1 Tax=Streptomyces sp. HU2014 TaxID=2939414 RepID=UPI00200BD810|nr:hypothetical protein [Streptomyces sp. HU2014]UQI49836.1 hypothetical protein M1P56_35695 [Streptomyces sp. HU2014]